MSHVLLPLLPGLEEEVDGAGDDEQEAVGDDVAAWKVIELNHYNNAYVK